MYSRFPDVQSPFSNDRHIPWQASRHRALQYPDAAPFHQATASACYVSEGSVGEWGSLYLHQEKAAPESIAALVFAGFSICSLLCRLVADRLRNNFGDFLVSTAGATLALAGMLTVLSSSSWSICLIGYAMMGLGQAPIVPIAFSRAGAIKGVSTARATSLVSLLAYVKPIR